MKAKRIVTVFLLLFVVFSIGMIINKETKKVESVSQIIPNETQTVVYYFHGTKRCQTCNKIEALTKQSIDQNFATLKNDGKLEIQSINVEEPANKHFIDDFQLSMKTVVIANYKDGKITNWKNCDKVWQLVGNETEFQNYIKNATLSLLEG